MSLRTQVSASHHFSDFWCHLYFSSPCLLPLLPSCPNLFFIIFLSFTLFLEVFFPSRNGLAGFWVLRERQTPSLAHADDSFEATLFSGLKPGSLRPRNHLRLDCALCREQEPLAPCGGRLTCQQLGSAVGATGKAEGAEKPEHPSLPFCSTVASRHVMTYTCLNDRNESSCKCGPPLVCKGDNC